MAGLQVPVTPLLLTPGKTGGLTFIQTDCDGPKVNAGVRMGFTVTVNVIGGAQGSLVLVNTYVPLFVLLTTAGVQVPVCPMSEAAGNAGAGSPLQMVAFELGKLLNTGGIMGLTVNT